MKQVKIWLNEKEFKELKRIAEKNGKSIYATVKPQVKKFLDDNRAVNFCIFYWILCYSLMASTVILIF